MPVRVWYRLAIIALALSLGPFAQAQVAGSEFDGLLFARTKGAGPGETVTGFEVAPNALAHRPPSDVINKLGNSLIEKNDAAQAEAAAALGRDSFGIKLGINAAIGTLAEHALWLEEIAPVNAAYTYIGLALGVAQVARDAAAGRDDAALTGGIKTWMSFSISKWGTGAMQIGGVALFVVDVTLTQWQGAVVSAAKDVWACRYKAWYQNHPRPMSEWKAIIWKAYLDSEKDSGALFGTYVDGILNEYVGRAFKDELLPTYGDCNAASFGLEHSSIQNLIMQDFKSLLERALAEKVMPEIADRAFLRNLEAQIPLARQRLMPVLNRVFELTVTAYGYPEGTPVIVDLPAGGRWGGKLRADSTMTGKITYYAIEKAGFPDKVRIEGPNGSEERRLALEDGRLTATFGTPEVQVVARYLLSEEAGTCEVARIASDGTRSTETAGSPQHALQHVDFAILPNGSWVVGKYDISTGWPIASPGVATSTGIELQAPFFDAITRLENCGMGFLSDGSLAGGSCTVTRFDSKAVSARTTIERTCRTPASLSLEGIFASVVTGEMDYYPVDGAEGKAIVDILKQSLRQGVKSGQAVGMPTIPGGQP